ncbi:ABC-three component system middle component 7 [Undibacterium sp. TC4M20W]|uniref:ABC-three component system middle component 7 n=1 Tax=Undibacterium sp. TC4M20W TaxID=3413052 RepID=UPI003BF240CD
MITPNKFITLKQSVLGRLPLLLASSSPITLHQLYMDLESEFPDINEFIFALDSLYVLGRIHVDLENGIVRHVN